MSRRVAYVTCISRVRETSSNLAYHTFQLLMTSPRTEVAALLHSLRLGYYYFARQRTNMPLLLR